MEYTDIKFIHALMKGW